jgi:hypothetical protein
MTYVDRATVYSPVSTTRVLKQTRAHPEVITEAPERTALRQRFDCRVDHDFAQELPLRLQGREATGLDELAGDQNELRKESVDS